MRALQEGDPTGHLRGASAGTETARHEGTARTTVRIQAALDCGPARRLPAMRALQDHVHDVGALQQQVRHGDCPP